MALIEKLEKDKKNFTKTLLFEDFIQKNEMLKKVKQEKENVQTHFKKIDKYQYFPFVGSDTVEQYRRNIST
jgi:hypothetical protein